MQQEYSEYDYYQAKYLEEKEHERIKTFLDTLSKRGQHTPDAAKIRLQDNILLFVYDNLMLGGTDNSYLRGFPYLGKAKSVTDNFVVKYSDQKSVIAFNTTHKDEKGGYICGEVYAVKPNTIFELDELKDNGGYFIRIEKHLVLTGQFYNGKDKQIKHPVLPCTMYVGNRKKWPIVQMNNIGCLLTNKNKRIYEHYPRVPNGKSIFELNDDEYWHANMYPHHRSHMN